MKMTDGKEPGVVFETAKEQLLYEIGYTTGQRDAWYLMTLRKRVQAKAMLAHEEKEGDKEK